MNRILTTLFMLSLLVATLLPAATAHAQSGNQWQISYYPNLNWGGPPVYTQYVSVLNLNWGGGSPGPGVPGENFTAYMTSSIFFYAGIYRFTLIADDEVALTIGNETYFSTMGAGQSGKTQVVDVPIDQQGVAPVRVDFRQYSGPAYISVSWDFLKGNDPGYPPPPPPPPANPAPPPSGGIVTRFGDYTRCMQQNLHQAQCFQADGSWDAPNMGSIQMEPQIRIWQNCKGDSEQRQQFDPTRDRQPGKCSKTEAGWFPE
jgi:hypothetical protein